MGEAFSPVDVPATATRVGLRQQPLLQFDHFRDRYGADIRTAATDEQHWQTQVMDALMRYAALPQGWDSYSGHPLRWDVGAFAMCVLSSVMRAGTPAPQIVPSPEGAIQIEWHEKGVDLELYIAAPYSCEVAYRNNTTGADFTEELSNDFSLLSEPIRELTSR
jgi:hypothetical protein